MPQLVLCTNTWKHWSSGKRKYNTVGSLRIGHGVRLVPGTVGKWEVLGQHHRELIQFIHRYPHVVYKITFLFQNPDKENKMNPGTNEL